MASYATLARPYAKAVFEQGQADNSLSTWSEQLAALETVTTEPQVAQALQHPALTRAQKGEIVTSVLGDASGGLLGLVAVLADNDRLGLVSELRVLFEQLRAAAEARVDASVTSATPLSDAQQLAIRESLAKRLAREVSLTCDVDDTLIGGAIIRAGDLVIDGSLRGRLEKLERTLST